MQYLNAIFTVGQPQSTEGIACEACVYGRGEHAADCRRVVESDESYEASEAILSARNRCFCEPCKACGHSVMCHDGYKCDYPYDGLENFTFPDPATACRCSKYVKSETSKCS